MAKDTIPDESANGLGGNKTFLPAAQDVDNGVRQIPLAAPGYNSYSGNEFHE